MKLASIIVASVMLTGVSAGHGRTYRPVFPASVEVPAKSGYRPVNPSARPALHGLRPPDVEVLLDALTRKHPKTIGNNVQKASRLIIRNALVDSRVRARLRGIHAEALFLKLNPQYGYVAKANAPQNDVYALKADRRPPLNAQIKTHTRPNPAAYARDMMNDHSAHEFRVPDDHVQPLKDYWSAKVKEFEAKGLVDAAGDAAKKLARVKGLGFTSQELDSSLLRVVRYLTRERNAPYVSMGVGLGLAAAPELWSFIKNGSWSDHAAMNLVRGSALVATERLTSYAIKRSGKGHLLGKLKGNAMIAGAVLLVDMGFTIHQYGGSAAFGDSRFYAHAGGTVGAMALGWAVGTPVAIGVTYLVAASPIAPAAPIIGPTVGFLAGTAASFVGYVGGESATRWMLETMSPEFLRAAEREKIAMAKSSLELRIQNLQSRN